MGEAEHTMIPEMKGKGMVSILDESLFTGEQKTFQLLCTVAPELITIAAVDQGKNKFTGFEGFHFPKPLSDEQLAQKISELTFQSSILKKVDFNNVSVQVVNPKFTFIPSALFKAEDAAQYFRFNHGEQEGESIHFDVIKGYEAVNIFSVPGILVSAIKKLFEKFSLHHHLTSLVDAARFHTPKNEGKCLFVHVRPSGLDLIVTEERKLIFANVFPFKNTEDGIYYVMMVCEQMGLNPEKAEVVISGQVEKESPFISQLKKYIRNVSFGGRIRSAAFTYGFDELPSHYYHAAFSHILCES